MSIVAHEITNDEAIIAVLHGAFVKLSYCCHGFGLLKGSKDGVLKISIQRGIVFRVNVSSNIFVCVEVRLCMSSWIRNKHVTFSLNSCLEM